MTEQEDTEENRQTRREFIAGAVSTGKLAKYLSEAFIGNYSTDLLHQYDQNRLGVALKSPGWRYRDQRSDQVLNKLSNGEDIKCTVAILDPEETDSNQIKEEVESVMNSLTSTLPLESTVSDSKYNVECIEAEIIDYEIYNLIESNNVKDLEENFQANQTKAEAIENYLEQEFGYKKDERDLTCLLGPFDTSFGEYIGTDVREDLSAVAYQTLGSENSNIKQITHNFGHNHGLTHSSIPNLGNPMNIGIGDYLIEEVRNPSFTWEERDKLRRLTP